MSAGYKIIVQKLEKHGNKYLQICPNLTKQKICMREYLLAYSIFEVYAGISQKIQ
jgi:hypothetical protein